MVDNNLKFDIHVDYIKIKFKKELVPCTGEAVFYLLNIGKCLLIL